MKKILILGVGNAQVDLIEYCKKHDFEVHGCSYQHGDSGEMLVDKFALIDITNVQSIEKYVIENSIDYVYSVGSDIAMPSVASVCKNLKLNCFISADTARICNTKNELRAYLGNDFLGNIRFQEISSKDDQIKLAFPLMLKPSDAQGQRGVFKISSQEEFDKYINTSLSYSRKKQAIIEEFIDGDEISVNTFSVDGKCIFKLISDRVVWDEFPGGIIHEHLIPSKYDNGDLKVKIEDLVDRVLEKLNILNGPAYFQIKVNKGTEPKLVEVTPRLDGCHMWRLINQFCNVNLLEMSMNLLQNSHIDYSKELKLTPVVKKVKTEFLCQAPGTKVDKSKFDITDACYCKWYYEDNEVVKKMNGYMEKCGYKISKQ